MLNWRTYESFCCNYLVTEGGYSQAWTWQNIPENKLFESGLINEFETLRLERKRNRGCSVNNPLQDIGVDLLAQNGEQFLVGQSKFYSETNTLKPVDLAGFFRYMAIPSLINRHQFHVFHTTTLSRVLGEDYECRRYHPNLQFIKLPMPDDYQVESGTGLATECVQLEPLVLRDYQLEAIDKLKRHFFQTLESLNDDGDSLEEGANSTGSELSDSKVLELEVDSYDCINDGDQIPLNLVDKRRAGIMSLPGGTGKTVIFLTFAKSNYKYCIVLSPTRVLASQTLERGRVYYSSGETYFKLIDSDGSRDFEVLKGEISGAMTNNQQILISATFKSCDVIRSLLSLFSRDDLLLILDEFHNVPKCAITDSTHDMNIILRIAQNVLSVSATPRCYSLETDDASQESGECLANTLFGEKIYELSLKVAVQSGYICDYQLWLPSVWHTENNTHQLTAVGNDLALDLEKIEWSRYLKMTVLVNWMLQEGLRRVIVYVLFDREGETRSTEQECELLSKIFVDICEKYHCLKKYTYGTILGDTSRQDRDQLINRFIEEEDSLNILFNCRVLDEGVDIPACDGIFIAYGAKEKVRNVQRLYRCLRRHGDKQLGHCLYWGDDDSTTATFLSSLMEFDPDYRTKLRIQSTNYGINETRLERETRSEMDQVVLDNLIVKATPYQDLWYQKLELARTWLDINKRKPMHKCSDPTEKMLRQWISHQIQYYKNRTMVDVKRLHWEKFMKEYASFVDLEYQWYDQLDILKKWIDTNKRRPTDHSDDNIERKLAKWCLYQIQKYKNSDQILDTKQQHWCSFLAEYAEYFMNDDQKWYDSLNSLKMWIDLNKRRPGQGSKDKQAYTLDKWGARQFLNYKNNISSFDENRRQHWEKFVSEYGEYFMDDDQKWNNHLAAAQKWIDTNKRKPSRDSKNEIEKRIGNWISCQLQNYRNRKFGLKDGDVKRLKWHNFVLFHKNIFTALALEDYITI